MIKNIGTRSTALDGKVRQGHSLIKFLEDGPQRHPPFKCCGRLGKKPTRHGKTGQRHLALCGPVMGKVLALSFPFLEILSGSFILGGCREVCVCGGGKVDPL